MLVPNTPRHPPIHHCHRRHRHRYYYHPVFQFVWITPTLLFTTHATHSSAIFVSFVQSFYLTPTHIRTHSFRDAHRTRILNYILALRLCSLHAYATHENTLSTLEPVHVPRSQLFSFFSFFFYWEKWRKARTGRASFSRPGERSSWSTSRSAWQVRLIFRVILGMLMSYE